MELINDKEYELIQELISSGVDLNKNFGNFTPLQQAVLNRDEKMVKLLVDNGADVNYKTPIFLSVCHCNYDKTYFDNDDLVVDDDFLEDDEECGEPSIRIFNYLIQTGADINKLDEHGISFLGYCAYNIFIHFMKLALDNGADINIRENIDSEEQYFTPLMTAASNAAYAACKFLLDRGALINLQDLKGNTALMNAVIFETNKQKTIEKLVGL